MKYSEAKKIYRRARFSAENNLIGDNDYARTLVYLQHRTDQFCALMQGLELENWYALLDKEPEFLFVLGQTMADRIKTLKCSKIIPKTETQNNENNAL